MLNICQYLETNGLYFKNYLKKKPILDRNSRKRKNLTVVIQF